MGAGFFIITREVSETPPSNQCVCVALQLCNAFSLPPTENLTYLHSKSSQNCPKMAFLCITFFCAPHLRLVSGLKLSPLRIPRRTGFQSPSGLTREANARTGPMQGCQCKFVPSSYIYIPAKLDSAGAPLHETWHKGPEMTSDIDILALPR